MWYCTVSGRVQLSIVHYQVEFKVVLHCVRVQLSIVHQQVEFNMVLHCVRYSSTQYCTLSGRV